MMKAAIPATIRAPFRILTKTTFSGPACPPVWLWETPETGRAEAEVSGFVSGWDSKAVSAVDAGRDSKAVSDAGAAAASDSEGVSLKS